MIQPGRRGYWQAPEGHFCGSAARSEAMVISAMTAINAVASMSVNLERERCMSLPR
jgi:hypothetical protein